MIQLLAWDERNYTEQMKNFDNKRVSETKDTTIKTKTSLMKNDWRDIIDPKLRKKLKDKAYYQANKERLKSKSSFWYKNNKDKRQAWDSKNKSKKIKQVRSWQIKNKNKVTDYRKTYQKQRYSSDVQFRLSVILRNRLKQAIKNNFKIGSAIKNLGCSIEQLKSYLESKFLLGMSWDNYGVHGWHIDHIKPLSAFDLSDKKQMLEACHYTNLQPLWAKDNLSKNDNY
jgi:hypothetical protein